MLKVIATTFCIGLGLVTAQGALADTLCGAIQYEISKNSPPRDIYKVQQYTLVFDSFELLNQLRVDFNSGTPVCLIGKRVTNPANGELEFRVSNFTGTGGGVAAPR